MLIIIFIIIIIITFYQTYVDLTSINRLDLAPHDEKEKNVDIALTEVKREASTSRQAKSANSKMNIKEVIPSTRLWEKQRFRKGESIKLFNMTYMLSKYIPLESQSIRLGPDSASLYSIYNRMKDEIVHSCRGNDLYSFCQHHSLILWDSFSRSFYTYSPQPYPSEKSSYDLTFVAHTTYV